MSRFLSVALLLAISCANVTTRSASAPKHIQTVERWLDAIAKRDINQALAIAETPFSLRGSLANKKELGVHLVRYFEYLENKKITLTHSVRNVLARWKDHHYCYKGAKTGLVAVAADMTKTSAKYGRVEFVLIFYIRKSDGNLFGFDEHGFCPFVVDEPTRAIP